MIAKVTQDAATRVNVPDTAGPVGSSAHASLLMVLCRRRWILFFTTLLALVVAAAYLVVATPIFTSSSSVYIEQNGAKIMADSQGLMAKSDSFLYTQAEIIKSAPIIAGALEKVDYRRMKTFNKVDNAVAWLQMGKAFNVEVGKKDDVVTVSLDSPYPQEAAEVVNSIVDAYMTAQGARKKTTAAEMLKVLQKEKDKRYAELSDKIRAMLEFKEHNGALSFQADKGNIILERLAKLSDSLTNLELETVRIKSDYDAAKYILSSPEKIRAYVEALQTKANSGGDRQYEEARSELLKYQTALFTLEQVHGQNSRMVQTVQANMAGLEASLLAKERSIAEQRVTQLEQELSAAQANEDKVREAFMAQQKVALELNSREAGYARLQEEVNRTEKQCGDLDNRVKEVTVNSEETGALNIQVVEAARVEEKPTKPRKPLTMAAALLIGLIVGTGLSLGWDWLDQRIRTPDEVSDSLGIPILGVVPQILGNKTQVLRGQYVHLETRSVVAEAYRTVRTAVHFGSDPNLRTILVTSPAPGDGKSTTASNLAITLAQAGHRTLLLDADLRKPVQHKIFELDASAGVSSVVQGKKKLWEVIQASPIPRLDVLPCGPIPGNPSEIIAGNRFAQVLAAVSEGYDRVVIDSPPVMAVTDGRILAASADATILVLRTNRSTRKGSRLAYEALLSTGAQVIGSIVNAMPQQAGVYGYYYGRYGSYATSYSGELPQEGPVQPVNPADSTQGHLPEEALVLHRRAEPSLEPMALAS